MNKNHIYSACIGSIMYLLISPYAIAGNETITLGMTERCPYICNNSTKGRGALVDIIETILKENGITIKVKIMPRKRILSSVRNGKLDGVIGILKRNAPDFVFPQKSIGQLRYLLYTHAKDDWIYTGLHSLKNRKIAVEEGKSYGIFDSYIQRHSADSKLILKIYDKNITKRLLKLLKGKRASLFLEDENVLNYHMTTFGGDRLNEAGSIPPDNLYVGFSPKNKNSQRYADMVTNGINEIRQSGELGRIFAKYGMSDWINWTPKHRDPFAGNYVERLERAFSYQKKNIESANIIFEGATAKGGGYWQYAAKFKESLERLSNGKLTVQLKFGVDNTEHDIVMNIAEGKSHMGMIATNNLTPFAPSLGFLALPYMFPSEAGIKKLFRDPLMEEISDRAGLESNVRTLSFFIGGYRLLANSVRVVKTTNDLQGLKIRVPRNQLMIGAFRTWGVEATPLPWTGVWPALESGLVQGQENPINIIFDAVNKTQEIWDVLKYITNIKYFMFTAPHMMSESFYRQLSPESRELVRKAAREAEDYSWEVVKKEDRKTTEFAKSKGMQFVDPINEVGDWQAKARSIWPKFYYRVGGKALVDEVLTVIDES